MLKNWVTKGNGIFMLIAPGRFSPVVSPSTFLKKISLGDNLQIFGR